MQATWAPRPPRRDHSRPQARRRRGLRGCRVAARLASAGPARKGVRGRQQGDGHGGPCVGTLIMYLCLRGVVVCERMPQRVFLCNWVWPRASLRLRPWPWACMLGGHGRTCSVRAPASPRPPGYVRLCVCVQPCPSVCVCVCACVCIPCLHPCAPVCPCFACGCGPKPSCWQPEASTYGMHCPAVWRGRRPAQRGRPRPRGAGCPPGAAGVAPNRACVPHDPLTPPRAGCPQSKSASLAANFIELPAMATS